MSGSTSSHTPLQAEETKAPAPTAPAPAAIGTPTLRLSTKTFVPKSRESLVGARVPPGDAAALPDSKKLNLSAKPFKMAVKTPGPAEVKESVDEGIVAPPPFAKLPSETLPPQATLTPMKEPAAQTTKLK